MSKFSDTEWDTKATGARLDGLNKQCHDLAKRVKYPTRFPIVPLESTLARGRAAAKACRVRKALAEIDANISLASFSQSSHPTAVDGYGRTRAATKRLSSGEKVMRKADVIVLPDVQSAGHKRRRAQGAAAQLPGSKKVKTQS